MTLLATFASIAGWLRYDASRQGSLQLSAATPPLLVEILDQAEQTLRVETAPMQNPVKLPAGVYQVRASAEGALSESFGVTVTPGRELKFSLDTQDQLLWPQNELESSFDITPFENSHALVTWNKTGLVLSKRLPRQTSTTSLLAASLPDPAQAPGLQWPWPTTLSENSGYGPYDLRPWVAQQKIDADGDGQLDLIMAARHQAWLAAISVNTGQVLWVAARGRDVTEVIARADSFPNSPVISSVLSDPIMDHDCDGDGTPDIVAIFAEMEASTDLNSSRPTVKYWMEAISSKTGNTIWRYDVPSQYFAVDPNDVVPRDLRWFVGHESGYSAGSMGSGMIGRHRVRFGGWLFERRGPHGYRPAAFASITIGSAKRLGIVAGRSFFSIDPVTGNADREPIDLSIRPGHVCQWGDLDGDGDTDLVMLETVTMATTGGQIRLSAWSPTKQKLLWDRNLDAEWPRMPAGSIEAPRWPLVTDLDGDGKCEVIAPDGRAPVAKGSAAIASQAPWGAISIFDGATGKARWSQRLVTMDCQIDHVLDGPDIDQDGCRDLFVVTLSGNEFHAYVDALSGRSGEKLWTNSTSPPSQNNSSDEYLLAPLKWWQSGTDGWPQLLVHVVPGGYASQQNVVGGFSARDGHITRVGHNITSLRPADMDGDGVQDLLVFNSKMPPSLDNGGELHCLRGVASEPWAQLGDRGEPLCDCDGDGVRDLIAGWPNSALVATSGSTGKTLWRTEINSDWREFQARSAAARSGATGDLDGDGICDLLGWTFVSRYQEKEQPFYAISGKTGKRLWSAQEIEVQIVHKVLTAETHDIDGDGQLEALFIASLDYGYRVRPSISTHESQLWMFVCSGQTGKLRWAIPLSSAYDGTTRTMLQVNLDGPPLSPTVADIDGDGSQEILIPFVMPDGRSFVTSARRGKDGAELWSRPYATEPNRQTAFANWIPPTVCDLDGDGRAEIVVVESRFIDATGQLAGPFREVVALAGESGNEIWKSSIEMPATSAHHQVYRSTEFARAQILRAQGNTQQLAVLTPGAADQISVFAGAGERQIWGNTLGPTIQEIWVCDADRDGRDDVVALEQNRLSVLAAADPMSPLWTYSLGSSGPYRVLGIQTKDRSAPPIAAIGYNATDNSVVGIDLSTGQRMWSVAGVISRFADGTYSVPRQLEWLNDFTNTSTNANPFIYTSYDSVSRVRCGAVSTGAHDMGEQPSMGNRIGGNSSVATPSRGWPIREHADERWARALPWVVETISLAELMWNIAWLMLLSALLIVIPVVFLYRLVRRQFSLQSLLGLPIAAGLISLGILMEVPIAEDVHTLGERLGMATIYTPLVGSIGFVISWMMRRRWRRVLTWLACTCLASLVCAAVMMWFDAVVFNPMLPEESYRFQGWPLIWLIGTYATAWLLLLALTGERLLRWIRNWFRSAPKLNSVAP